jgi:hypothetical protein
MIAGEMTDRDLRFGDAMMTRPIDRKDARLNAADDLKINGARGRLRSAKKIVPGRRFNDRAAGATTGPSADLTISAVPNSEAAGRNATNVPVGNGLFLRAVRTVLAVVAHHGRLDPSVAAGAVRRIGLVDVDLPEVARRNAPNAGTSGNNACRDLPPQFFE